MKLAPWQKKPQMPFKNCMANFNCLPHGIVNSLSSPRSTRTSTTQKALAPIRRFMAGPQATLFAEARSFINHNATNFSYLDGDEHTQLKKLLDDPKCYVGNGMKQAKTLLDNLRSRLETLSSEARAAAEQAVTSKVQKLASIDGYDKLTDEQKKKRLSKSKHNR
jgi:hypothetical protein